MYRTIHPKIDTRICKALHTSIDDTDENVCENESGNIIEDMLGNILGNV